MEPNTYDVDAEYPPISGPDAVVALMAGVFDAALAAGVAVVHPAEVAVEPGGRLTLTLAPERSGATPQQAAARTLAYSVGAIGALAALGSLPTAPADALAHQGWHQAVTTQLKAAWRGRFGAEPVADWIGRCMAFDPMERPRRLEMGAELRELARRSVEEMPRVAAPLQLRSEGGLSRALPRALPVAVWSGVGRSVGAVAPRPGWPHWAAWVLGGLTLVLVIASCALGGLAGRLISETMDGSAAVQALPPLPPASVPSPPLSAAPTLEAAAVAPPAPEAIDAEEAAPRTGSASHRKSNPVEASEKPGPTFGTTPRTTPPTPPTTRPTTPRREGAALGSDLRDPWQQPKLEEDP